MTRFHSYAIGTGCVALFAIAAFGFQQLLRGVGDRSCGVVVARVDAQRSAVRGNFLDVEDA